VSFVRLHAAIFFLCRLWKVAAGGVFGTLHGNPQYDDMPVQTHFDQLQALEI